MARQTEVKPNGMAGFGNKKAVSIIWWVIVCRQGLRWFASVFASLRALL